jgi:YD repeat-containing protein
VALLAHGVEIGTTPCEDVRPCFCPETSADLLLNLRHAKIPFRLIILPWNGLVMEDTKGNLQNAPGFSAVAQWDDENRLATATVGPAVNTYAYDALGRRLQKTAGGVVTTFLRRGADIRYIQQFLGHSSVDTTKIYLRLVPGHLKADYDEAMPEIAIGLDTASPPSKGSHDPPV